MIKVLVGTNTNKKDVVIDPERTLREVLDENNVDYTTGGIHLSGLAVGRDGLDKSFSDYGVTDVCTLISVVKGDGGTI